MVRQVDILVVGGGPTGVVAAIQAARAGARTLLVEKSAMLGGTTTVAGVYYVSLFHAHTKQVIAGIGWELMLEAARAGGAKLPTFDKPYAKQNGCGVPVNIPIYCTVADRMVIDSGCDLLFHTMIASVERFDDQWKVMICTKLGLKEVRAKVLIDCTGDANLVQMAGYPVTHHPKLQPGTLLFQLAGYDPKNIDIPAVQIAFEAACAAGTMRSSDAGWSDGKIERLIKSRGFNAIHVCDIDANDSEGRTHAEIKARRIMFEVYQFLKQFPGMQHLTIATMQPECGIRETRIIQGETCITLDDYWNGRVWEDSLCYSFYPIDLHTDDGLDYRELQPGVVPTIPRGAMIPQHSQGILAPGRHMCGDRMAHSAFRVQSSCMAAGQAAAAVAALAVQQGCEPRDVPIDDVRELLVKHDAIVPPKVAVESLTGK